MKLIAIDGPAGVGKSSASRLLSQRLGCCFFSSGLIYRAMAWYLLEEGWRATEAEPPLERLTVFSLHVGENGALSVEGQPLPVSLDSEEIAAAASRISALPAVRERSNAVQRETVRRIGAEGRYTAVVLDGRDIGTVVFPKADHKFFLTASVDIRAGRRYRELLARQGEHAPLEEVREAVRLRDEGDRNREMAPLHPAADAVVIDSSTMTLEEVVQHMLALIGRKKETPTPE